METCEVTDCDRQTKNGAPTVLSIARFGDGRPRLCESHYRKWKRYGDPTHDGRPQPRPWVERLLARRTIKGECWIWTGAVGAPGYGLMNVTIDGVKKTKLIHRIAHELFIGPIPDGLHVDHLCNERLCFNPAHLEAVTQAENNRRMLRRMKASA